MGWEETFRRAKLGVVGCDSFRAHWGLGLQKLELLRFQNCAWLCRANGSGAYDGGSPKGLPYTKNETSPVSAVGAAHLGRPSFVGHGACRARPPGRAVPPTDGRPRGSPLQDCKNVWEAWKPQAAQCAAPTEIRKRLRLRRPPEPNLGPANPKGALSTGRSTAQRFPEIQRQR